MKLNTYLLFDGRCEEAFTYYAKCLGGKIESISRFGETPAGGQAPADWQNKILHAHLTVGENNLMGSDAPPGQYELPQGFSVFISVQTPEEADRVFKDLSANGKITLPIQETFWSPRFGMLVDQFGTPWFVNCDQQK